MSTSPVESKSHTSNDQTIRYRRIGHSKLRIELPRTLNEDNSNEVRKHILNVPGVCRAKATPRKNKQEGDVLLASMRTRVARVSPDQLIEIILEATTAKISNIQGTSSAQLSGTSGKRQKERFHNKHKPALATTS